MYVLKQLAFSYTVLLCLLLKKRGTVAFYMSVDPFVRQSVVVVKTFTGLYKENAWTYRFSNWTNKEVVMTSR